MSQSNIVPVLFWICAALLLYTFAGYPLLIGLLARWFARKITLPESACLPTVTVVLAAANEENRIAMRLLNLLSANFPNEKLDIVVVSDGSTDQTEKKIRQINDPRIQLLTQTQRSGKAQCLNLALSVARGEIIVFADTRQRFTPETIPELVKHFNDPQVGAVSGALLIESSATSVGGGVDLYWRLEKFIRSAESKWDSSIGCTGAVYAIRRSLFQPIPADTLLDDVVVPMQIALQNYRVTFEPAAVAFDPQSLEPERERIRKQRTLAGNFQMLFRYTVWLLPWRNRLWWQLISHKYLRLASPFLMLLLLLTNAALISNSFYRFVFVGQILFYALALIGMFFPRKKIFLLSIPAGFVFLNWAVLRGLWYYFQSPAGAGWQTAPSVKNKTASHV